MKICFDLNIKLYKILELRATAYTCSFNSGDIREFIFLIITSLASIFSSWDDELKKLLKISEKSFFYPPI